MKLKLPKIARLDLRSHEIIIAEHNARPGALQLAIWNADYFRRAVHNDQVC